MQAHTLQKIAELAYYALPFDSTPPRLTPAGSVANRLESLNKVLRAYADMDLAKVNLSFFSNP